jgi:hypothetical protein
MRLPFRNRRRGVDRCGGGGGRKPPWPTETSTMRIYSLSGLHKYSIVGPHRGDANLRHAEVDVSEVDTVEHDLRGAL